MDADLPLPWQRADLETWYADWEHINRHALIKKMEGKFSMVVGTLTDLEFSTVADTLIDAIAVANRWILCVENLDEKQLKKMRMKFI